MSGSAGNVALANDAWARMLTLLPLRDAVDRCDALYSIIESIARRPEEGNYVLRLENDAFGTNVLGSKGKGTAAVECLQFLFAVGYRRRAEVTEGDVPSDAGGRVLQSVTMSKIELELYR